MSRKISLIAAVADNGIIGNNGTLPWHLKKDFSWFIKQTTGKIVIMGRKNFEDIIKFTKGKPLKDRTNIVLTKNNIHAEGFLIYNNIQDILEQFKTEDLMIIGGTQIYKAFMPYANQLILTEIHHDFQGDTFFPSWEKHLYTQTYKQTETENYINYDFCIYDSINK